MNDRVAPAGAPPRTPRVTTAGRLLRAVAAADATALGVIGERIGVSRTLLEGCRDGTRALEPGVQMAVAALVLEVAPVHARLAHQLYAQAQAALRVAAGDVELHKTDPRAQWR